MTDAADRRQLLTDVRDLIEIVDRRIVQLRQSGPPDVLERMKDIRAHMVRLQESVAPETRPTTTSQAPGSPR